MNPMLMNTTKLLLLTAISLFSTQLIAQNTADNDEELKWYQVELFIFANNSLDGASHERWPRELSLKYPPLLVELQDTSSDTSVLPLLLENEALYNFQREQAEALANSDDDSSGHDVLIDPPNLSPSAQPANPDQSTEAPQGPPTDLEPAFILLDQDQQQLSEIVRRTLAEADFRLLFHQTWRQPIGKRNETASLLIHGGDQFDNHFELEGSINLSVSRYLHLTTDLWLSSFVSNVGRDKDAWPILPTAPFNTAAKPKSISYIFSNTNSHSDDYSLLGDFKNHFSAIANNQFSVEQTVALRQHRRMRSNELHYIDHPLMGLLIKITPYDRFPVSVEP